MKQLSFFANIETKTKSKKKEVKYNCESCGLFENVFNPQIGYCGNGKKKILVLTAFPDRDSDKRGIPYSGQSGKLMQKLLKTYDIDFDDDCWGGYAVQCQIPKRLNPTNNELCCCSEKLENLIDELQPELIISFGTQTAKALLRLMGWKGMLMEKIHGLTFPFVEKKCWVGFTFDTTDINKDDNYLRTTSYEIEDILDNLGKSLPVPLDRDNYKLIRDSNEAVDLLERFTKENKVTAIDYEATTYNAYASDAMPLTIGLANEINFGYCIDLHKSNWNDIEYAYVCDAWKKFVESGCPIIVQNLAMEELWSRVHFNCSIKNLYKDTMVTHHNLYCRSGTASLDFQVRLISGDDYKDMVNAKKIIDEPIDLVAQYNVLDCRYLLWIDKVQDSLLDNKTFEFDKFIHRGLMTLVDMKQNGVYVDEDEITRLETEALAQIAEYENVLSHSEAPLRYLEVYKEELNPNSSKQLGNLIYGIYKEKIIKSTSKGQPSTDKVVLEKVRESTKHKNLKMFLEALAEKRVVEKYHKTIIQWRSLRDKDGFMHPSFNMHITESYRSSATDPNIQNVYKHNPKQKIIRKCIKPKKDIYLEGDYDALEVAVTAMITGDRTLHSEIVNGVDMHKLWTSEIFMKPEEEIIGKERFIGKQGFVFPTIYGSETPSIARSTRIMINDLAKELGTKYPLCKNATQWEAHIDLVRLKLWRKYPDIKLWQDTMKQFYIDYGYIRAVTGFKRFGPLSSEQIGNTPIQGPAFHLMYDAFTKINNKMKKYNFVSTLNFEVHDSITFDAVYNELDDLKNLSNEILLSKRFEWQIDVPLGVTWETGENWYDMKEI